MLPAFTPDELDTLARLDRGETLVVKLPGFKQPYSPFLRHLRATGRLVRIGRDSDWGNPHVLPKKHTDDERAAVIEAYQRHLLDDRPDLLDRLPELRGKALGCWCTPKPCHGDVLVRLIAGRITRPTT